MRLSHLRRGECPLDVEMPLGTMVFGGGYFFDTQCKMRLSPLSPLSPQSLVAPYVPTLRGKRSVDVILDDAESDDK